jgi:hypothetical protein
LVTPDLYLFILALGISGFIAFKTFQWVLYEEIGRGTAALFLGFAFLVFFGVNNHDFLKEIILQREDHPSEGGEASELMNSELQKQIEMTRLLTVTVGEVAESARELAMEAHRKGQAALEAAKKSHQSSEGISSITAWAAWELLMGEFTELEGYLRRWEEKNGLTRGRVTARSLTDLAQKLEPLSEILPETIKGLYFNRQRKYEILKKIKENSELSSSKLAETAFDLPAPPMLPLFASLNEPSSKPEGIQE